MIRSIVLSLFALYAWGGGISVLQYEDIKVKHTYENKTEEVIIKRHIDPKCLELGISYDVVFSGNYANEKVPDSCKKTFVTTLGSIQTIRMPLGIKTVGELEVLDLIVKSKEKPQEYVLIDSRTPQWYENSTIPSSVNIPYDSVAYDEDFPEDFKKLLKTFNIKKAGDESYDFSKAKTAILFCNGSWCVQSATAIGELLALGYPKEKLLWYRGGIQDWKILGLTTIRGDLK